jgi:hypothetical protein
MSKNRNRGRRANHAAMSTKPQRAPSSIQKISRWFKKPWVIISAAVTVAIFFGVNGTWVLDQLHLLDVTAVVEESDSQSPPSLPFMIKNDWYLTMHDLTLDCAGQISMREGVVIVTAGTDDFDAPVHMDANGRYLTQLTITNLLNSPISNVPITFGVAFPKPRNGFPISGNFGAFDMTSKPTELEPHSGKQYDCGPLLKQVAQGNPIVSAKVKVRASYSIGFGTFRFSRTVDSAPANCKWEGARFVCREGDAIVNDFP